MRVDLVDPPAYSPPYDHALASALARLDDTSVRLLTSAFAYGASPPPNGYERDEFFYRHARGRAGSRLRAFSKRAEHSLDMLRYRRAVAGAGGVAGAGSRAADVVHFQWLTVPRLDLRLLPARPTVLTIHDPLERSSRRGPIPAGAFRGVDAVIVHSEFAREQVVAQHGLAPDRIHVIRHGALGEVTGEKPTVGVGFSPVELAGADDGTPVVLSYGLIRPYKGIGTLLEAWRGGAGRGITDAQLWIVGRPMHESSSLRAAAPAGARLVPRFVTPEEEHALFERADIIVLPYEKTERFGFSGVLATALAYGKPIVLSDVGGFAEVTALGAARGVPPGDPQALRAALRELIENPARRASLAAAAGEAAATVFSWDAAAQATLALYEKIAGQ